MYIHFKSFHNIQVAILLKRFILMIKMIVVKIVSEIDKNHMLSKNKSGHQVQNEYVYESKQKKKQSTKTTVMWTLYTKIASNLCNLFPQQGCVRKGSFFSNQPCKISLTFFNFTK